MDGGAPDIHVEILMALGSSCRCGERFRSGESGAGCGERAGAQHHPRRSAGARPRPRSQPGGLTMRVAPAALQDTHRLCHHVLWAMHKCHLLSPGPTSLPGWENVVPSSFSGGCGCPVPPRRSWPGVLATWEGLHQCHGDALELHPRGRRGQQVPQGGVRGSPPAPLTIFSKLMRFSARVRLPSWMNVMSGGWDLGIRFGF